MATVARALGPAKLSRPKAETTKTTKTIKKQSKWTQIDFHFAWLFIALVAVARSSRWPGRWGPQSSLDQKPKQHKQRKQWKNIKINVKLLFVKFACFFVFSDKYILIDFKLVSMGFHWISIFQFLHSLNIMSRVSFSPGRDCACRHCWISFF